MNNICYIHSDTSIIRKDNILVSQASANFSVCRCNDVIFKMIKCRACNDGNTVHFYIKNCTCKPLSNLQIRIKRNNNFIVENSAMGEEYIYIEVGNIKECNDITINKFIVKCTNMPIKVCADLLTGNDIIKSIYLII